MKKPWYITTFCIAGWLWLLVLFPSVFSPDTKNIHLLLPTIYGIIIAGFFIAWVGIWHLKKWGLEWFFILLFIKLFVDNLTTSLHTPTNHHTNHTQFTIPLSFLFFFIYGLLIAIFFYKNMQQEL